MPFYKVMETVGAYTEGDVIDIIDPELYAIISRTVPLQPVDPIAVDIQDALYGAEGIATFPAAAAAADGVSLAEVLRYIQETQLSKIDAASTAGLLATADSLTYRISEGDRHFHSWERWLAVAAAPNGEIKVADRIGTGTAAFRATAGNNTWGAWLQILGSSDTPVVTGGVKYDIHRLSIVATSEVSATYFIQMGFGTTGAQALTDNTFSSFIYRVGSAQTRETPIQVQHRRRDVGSKAWLRTWCLTKNASTLDFYFGLHEYEG